MLENWANQWLDFGEFLTTHRHILFVWHAILGFVGTLIYYMLKELF